MNKSREKHQSKLRRIRRVRSKVVGTSTRPRLAVKRTLKHIYVQIIDDSINQTLVASSDKIIKDNKLNKTDIAFQVGQDIAKKAQDKKISQVVFDRRDKPFHGRVKAVAEGARQGGLQF